MRECCGKGQSGSMKGLELSRCYYEEHGKKMLAEQFGEEVSRIAVGLVGYGSECMGYDDALSADHDFEPGFCLWITEEDARRYGFRLERAYAKLPREFRGYNRSPLSPVGGNRHGVFEIGAFYRGLLGVPEVQNDPQWWLKTPSEALGAACNGEVFRDDLGAFSRVREALLAGYPEDVRRKKLAAHLALLSQAGEYNYPRSLARGEEGGALLSLFTFVKHAISAVYLLNNAYEPFYKWAFRGMRDLPVLTEAAEMLRTLLCMENTPIRAAKKQELVAQICAELIAELARQELSAAGFPDVGRHAAVVQNGIKDAALRNLHLMEGV